MDLSHRREETQRFGRRFGYAHLPPHLQPYSAPFAELAYKMIEGAPDSPDLTVALRHLLAVKDEYVRIGVDLHDQATGHGHCYPKDAGQQCPDQQGQALPLAGASQAQCCRSAESGGSV